MEKLSRDYKPKKLIGRYGTLEVYLAYQLGGINYFSGKNEARGYYLHFKPCNKNANGLTESVLMGDEHESGFKMLLGETQRKSAKQMREIWARIEPMVDELGELYEVKEYQEIAKKAGVIEHKREEAPAIKKSLLSDSLLARFKEVGKQESTDPIVVAKFFNPTGAGTWYATEYNDGVFYGYVSLFGDHNDEWGSFSLSELEGFSGPMGLGIERDKFCGEKRLSEFNIPSLK